MKPVYASFLAITFLLPPASFASPIYMAPDINHVARSTNKNVVCDSNDSYKPPATIKLTGKLAVSKVAENLMI